MIRALSSVVFTLLFFLTISLNPAYANWAYGFVVYNGNVYKATKTKINPEDIRAKIGEVTKYSDIEGTYSGNFSNMYPKGTGYYRIKDTDEKVAIAVKTINGEFIKVTYAHKYAGKRSSSYFYSYIIVGIMILALCAIPFFQIKKNQ